MTHTYGYQRGFSLVELMVVLVIIGLLAGVVTVSTRVYLVQAKTNAAKMEIASISEALETYYAMYDRYPTSDEGLDVLSEKLDGQVDSILRQKPIDPWGRAYQYNYPGREDAYDVYSLGADGKEGGEGADSDIGNWNLKQ